MKYVVLMFALFTVGAAADQRMETTGGFCHFVTPEGFATANDDNEVFASNCESSIRQDADGNGDGSTIWEIEYPNGAEPFAESYSTNGAETGINCVMVDSNGTTYATQDWDSTYKVKSRNRHSKSRRDVEIEYRLVCRNGAQQ